MDKKNLLTTIGLVIVVGVASFYGGMKYQQSKGGGQLATGGNFQYRGGAGGAGQMRRGGRMGGQFTNGTILSKDDKSITVSLFDGSGSKIVYFSSSTNIGKIAAGAASDLTVGERVMIGGTANNDGTMAAQSIQIRPDTGAGGPGAPGMPPRQ